MLQKNFMNIYGMEERQKEETFWSSNLWVLLYEKTVRNISSWSQDSWSHKLQSGWKLEIIEVCNRLRYFRGKGKGGSGKD